MSRIAILSDIHGNVPALDAVLADIASQDVDETLVGGDLVGRGPQGSAVTRRIRELGLATIGGNHEEYLLDFRRGNIPSSWHHDEEWAAARWMAAELTSEDVEYIAALPFSLRRPGMRLVHGTPASNRDGIGPWTNEARLEEHWNAVPEGVLVCAHTHRPLIRHVAQGMIVNIGSVGMPFNRDQAAQYAIFESTSDGWEVELRRVPYDLEEVYRAYDRTGFLADGGVTARLLRLELEHASPLLVPFLEWARRQRLEPSLGHLDRFFEFHRPGESLRHFFSRLQEIDA
ncbi:MAG: metallophosphoesterase family protein [Acidobacteriota bacterium]